MADTPPVIQPSAETLSPFSRRELFNDLATVFSEQEKASKGELITPETAHDDVAPEGEAELQPTPKSAAKAAAPAKPAAPTKPATPPAATPPAKPAAPPTAKAKDWKEMNAERMALKAEKERLENELADLKTRTTAFDKLKTDYDQLDTIVRNGMMDKDPRVIGPINQRITEAVALAKSAVPAEHAERVSSLLQQPESDWRTAQLEEVLEGLSPIRQARFTSAVNQVDAAQRERAGLSTRSDEWMRARAAERQQQIENQRSQLLQTFNRVGKEWASSLPLYQQIDGNDEHNAAVRERMEMAKNIFSGRLQRPDDLAKAAFWAAAAPGLLEGHKTLMEENARLKAELEELRGAGPGLGDGGAEGGAEGGEETKPENMSYGEWVARQASKELQFSR